MSKSVGLVIPAYKPNVSRLNEYIKSIRELDCIDTIHVELDKPMVVNDSSIAGFDSINKVKMRRGKGEAIASGFDFLSTDVLAFADADGAVPAVSLKKIILPVSNGNTSMAIGSRRHPDAHIDSHQTFTRRRMGDIFAWMASRLLSTSFYDYQCGAKALSSEVWDTIQTQISQSGFAFDLELIEMANINGFSINEIPVIWDDVPQSTVNPITDSVSMAMSLFTIRYRSKQFRRNH